MIVRKFTNYRNQVYLKSEGSQPSSTTPVAQLKKSNPLLKFSSLMTGRELFAFDNYECLLGAARQRALDTNNKSPAGVYQTILKEHWDALSEEDQANWNRLADAQGGDVGRLVSAKQYLFSTVLTMPMLEIRRSFRRILALHFVTSARGGSLETLKWLSSMRSVSPAEGIYSLERRFYCCGCLVKICLTLCLRIQAHSVHNHVHFGGTPEELELHHGKPWADFADKAIPRKHNAFC